MGSKKTRSSIAIVVIGCLFGVMGCRCQSEPDPEPEEVVEEADDAEAEEEAEQELVELFGLPLPPNYFDVRQYDERARVSTGMSLDELEEFFSAELVDYEVLRPEERLQVLPLRSEQAQATAYRYGGRRGHVVINYRRALPEPVWQRPTPSEPEEDEEPEEVAEVAERDEPSLPTMQTGSERPDWLDAVKGEPVELRTADGELVAPGARWGEPYTPPEGSPLDQERMRPNFGRPFGDWRAR